MSAKQEKFYPTQNQRAEAEQKTARGTFGFLGRGVRIRIAILAVACLLALVGVFLRGLFGKGEPQIQILATRVVTLTNPPKDAQGVLIQVDWKNVGSGPACVVKADVTASSATGYSRFSMKNGIIYANSTGIAPGETYIDSNDRYMVLAPIGSTLVTTATATITQAKNTY